MKKEKDVFFQFPLHLFSPFAYFLFILIYIDLFAPKKCCEQKLCCCNETQHIVKQQAKRMKYAIILQKSRSQNKEQIECFKQFSERNE